MASRFSGLRSSILSGDEDHRDKMLNDWEQVLKDTDTREVHPLKPQVSNVAGVGHNCGPFVSVVLIAAIKGKLKLTMLECLVHLQAGFFTRTMCRSGASLAKLKRCAGLVHLNADFVFKLYLFTCCTLR